MMTQNFSFSRILPVWLVLIAFLCGMILPSVAIARLEMAIATEGDPEDGLDCSGGGGGATDGSSGQSQSPPDFPRTNDCPWVYEFIPQHNIYIFLPVFFLDPMNGYSMIDIQWKAKK